VTWSTDVLFLQLVVGYLRTSETTGRLQLSDHTGSIDCVLAAWPSIDQESLVTEHCCASSSCMDIMTGGQVAGCPYAQTWLVDGVFHVRHFQLVVEIFETPNSRTVVVCPYVQFAATDLRQLSGQPRQKPLTLSSLHLPSPENARDRDRVTAGSHNTSARQIDSQNSSYDDMFASFLGSPSPQAPALPSVGPCRCLASQLFVVDFYENISLQSRHLEQLSLQFTVTGSFVGPPRVSSCGCSKSVGNSVPTRLPLVRPVAVLFGSRLVRWYPVLHPGCIYRLIHHSSDVSQFLGKHVLPRTQKTKLERHVSRRLIVLDTKVQLERIVHSSPSFTDLMLSADEEAAISAAVDEVRSRLGQSHDFWQQHCLATIRR